MTKRFAAVDLGSNTIKVTIADYGENKQFEKVLYKDFPSCLGHNMINTNIIDPDALAGCYIALNEIKRILKESKVEEYKCVATHALREALNQKEILAFIKSNTGIDVKVITGEEEARLTLKAVLIDLPSSKSYACINGGGGSTELSFCLPGSPGKEQLYFFRFGAINLYSDYLKDKPDIEAAINEIGELINREFKKMNITLPPKIDQVVSVGGSIYNAAYILKKDKKRNFDMLSNMRLSTPDLESVINLLKFAEEGEKINIAGMDTERLDTTLPGILIHYFLLHLLKKEELVISIRTISDGLIHSMAER